jgi:dipeptidase E
MATGPIVPVGGNPRDDDANRLERHLLDLSGADDPRVCFVPTASGDSEANIAAFYERFPSTWCRASHVTVFRPSAFDPLEALAAADVVYVGGGSTANMLALWRIHGIDAALRSAHERGAVLAGSSAGANCWFEASVTDSFGPLAPLLAGLGLLPGSFCPHYDSERERQPTYTRLVADGTLPAGYAGDDTTALHFQDRELVEVVSARPGSRAFRVHAVDGTAVEDPLPVRRLAS